MRSPRRKPTISLFTADTGHLSIAQAIHAHLKNDYHVHFNNVTGTGFDLYYPFYRYFPQLFKIPYQLSQRQQATKLINQVIDKTYRDQVTHLLQEQKPDIVVSTWYIPNQIIETYVRAHSLPFLNVITDPRTFHILLPSAHALNLVFDQHTAARCRALTIPAKKVKVTGWFVRPHFHPPDSKQAIRRQLKLKDGPTYLIAGGSEGTNLILKIIPTFLQTTTPTTVLIACGHNQRLHGAINYLNQANSYLKKRSRAHLIPLTFTPHLHRYLQASDLVIGKAGPNLLFESVACHVPFFAITHISGQEDGNLDIIKDYRLGYVEENPLKANRLLGHLITQPSTLTQFLPHLTRLASYNARAPQLLHDLLSKPYFPRNSSSSKKTT